MSKQCVLISIRPQWCELIANGKKTIEVRKSRPKLDLRRRVLTEREYAVDHETTVAAVVHEWIQKNCKRVEEAK